MCQSSERYLVDTFKPFCLDQLLKNELDNNSAVNFINFMQKRLPLLAIRLTLSRKVRRASKTN